MYGHIRIANGVDTSDRVPAHVTTTKDTKSTKESKHDAFDAIFQFGVGKVDKQSDLHPSQFHVGQQLGFVNSLDLHVTLEFEDQFVFNQNVNSVPTIEPGILVLYGLWMLELEFDSIMPQFMSQALFVGGFKWSRPSSR